MAVSQIPDRMYHVLGVLGIDQNVRPELFGACEPFFAPCPERSRVHHSGSQQRDRQPDRALAEHGNGGVTLEIQTVQRAPRGPVPHETAGQRRDN